jgi:hypothetical protein
MFDPEHHPNDLDELREKKEQGKKMKKEDARREEDAMTG